MMYVLVLVYRHLGYMNVVHEVAESSMTLLLEISRSVLIMNNLERNKIY